MICTVEPLCDLAPFESDARLKNLPPIHFSVDKGFTLESFVRFAELSHTTCICELGGADSVIFFHANAALDLQIELRQDDASYCVIAAGVLDPDVWTHVAVTVAGNGQTTLYKNGQAVKVGMLPVPKDVVRSDNFFGRTRDSTSSSFVGQMAEARIWNCVRSGAQLCRAVGALPAQDRAGLLHEVALPDDKSVPSRETQRPRRIHWQAFLDGSFSKSGHLRGAQSLPLRSGTVILQRVARADSPSLWSLGYTHDEAGNVAAFFCRDDEVAASRFRAPLRATLDGKLCSRATLPQYGGSYIRVGVVDEDDPRIDWNEHRDELSQVTDPCPPSLSQRKLPDATSGAPQLGSATQLGLRDGSFTVEVWLRGCELLPSCEYIVLGNDGAGEPLHFLIRGLRAGLRIGRREHLGTTTLRNGCWHHIAWSYDRAAQELRLFVDGVLDSVSGLPPFLGSGVLLLGSAFDASTQGKRQPMRGNLDEVRIFARARSQVEIHADRGRRLSGSELALSAVYRLGEQAGLALEFFGTPALGNAARPVAGSVELPPLRVDFAQGLTIEAWVRYKSLKPWARIADLGNGPSSNNIVLACGDSGTELAFLVYVGGSSRQLLAPGALCPGEWMHLAATIDSDGNGRLYKNGALIAAGKLAVPAHVPRSSCYLGKSNWSGDAPLEGTLSEVRLWNRARGEQELRRDQWQRLCGSEPGLCGNWRLDEKSGEIAYDHSGQGHAGRLTPGTASRQDRLLLGTAELAVPIASFDEFTPPIALPALDLDFSSGLTLEAWTYFRSARSGTRILDLGNGPTRDNIVLECAERAEDLALRICVGNVQHSLIAREVVRVGHFMHLAVSIDSDGNCKLYRDGVFVAWGTLPLPRNLRRTQCQLGGHDSATFIGMLAELRLWNRARTQAEIQADLFVRLRGDERGLCGYWQLQIGPERAPLPIHASTAQSAQNGDNGPNKNPLPLPGPLATATRAVLGPRPPRARAARRLR